MKSYPVFRAVSLFCTLLFSSCLLDRGKADEGGETGSVTDGDYVPVKPAAPAGWPALQWPKENPYTPAKDVLGRRLFFEGRLSRWQDRPCSWCHGPAAAFADVHGDSMSVGTGQGVTTRNTPTLANMAFARVFMLDGRAPTLEAQALGPLYAPNEMDMTGPEIVARLSADTAYVRLFTQAFGSGAITMERVTRALATYERTLISARSPYDAWRAGAQGALSAAALRGEGLFRSNRTGCAICHVPPLFTDGDFHNIGLDSVPVDAGLGAITGRPEDAGRFKTPTLRNITASRSYMHDARFKTLRQVLDHYNSGGKPGPNRAPSIRPLGLSPAELDDLTAFLEALTDTAFLQTPIYLAPNPN